MSENKFSNLGTKIIGQTVHSFKKVTSTNDLAWLEISRGADEGTVILADEQLKGRGRFGRQWFAPAGGGIWCSVILKPDLPIEKSGVVMVVGAIAVCELLQEKKGLPALIRWPNDVMIDGKKISGVIVETKYIGRQPEMMVLGIGLNVNLKLSEIPAELKKEVTSLVVETKKEVESESLVRDFLGCLDNWYQKIKEKDFESITRTWRKMCALTGKKVLFQSKGEKFEGEVVDLDPCAGISIRLKNNDVRLFRGEYVDWIRVK
ncbi:MAG: biotin--[acetyl-CoA-carboxylase] ligase [Planctomycetes bacterium]|nr:biotin--[acetyl-CoA-carboxylase] ligase [Planctomycetota bacterium]